MRKFAFTAVAASLLAPSGADAAKSIRHVVTGTNGPVIVELREVGRSLTLWTTTGRIKEQRRLETTDDVLPLLMNTRLAPLWPTLTRRFGPGLERLRAEMLERSTAAWAKGKRAFPADGPELASSGRHAALLQHARILDMAGKRSEAVALLREDLTGRPLTSYNKRIEQSYSAAQLAQLLLDAGQVEDAVVTLRTAEAQMGESLAGVNLAFARANLLARVGRGEEALEIIDPSKAQLDAHRKSIGGLLTTIPGTERYFAAIKACALAGLGRPQEAQEALAPALTEREPSGLLVQAIGGPNAGVRMMAYLCMRDRNGLVQEVLSDLSSDPVDPIAMGYLQPIGPDPLNYAPFLSTVRSDARLAGAPVRVLPPELVPALRNWSE